MLLVHTLISLNLDVLQNKSEYAENSGVYFAERGIINLI